MILKPQKIGAADLIVDLIPTTNKTSRPGYQMDPKFITIHNTGNRNADAYANSQYVDGTSNYVSWHFTVDDKRIYQELPTNEVAWHAGDGGSGPGNRTSIAIELCEHTGIDWEQAKKNAAKLVVILMKAHDIPIENVIPHKHWKSSKYPSGKYCPHKILDEGWDKFIDMIRAEDGLEPWERILYGALDMPAEWIDWIRDMVAKAKGIARFLPQLIMDVYNYGRSQR